MPGPVINVGQPTPNPIGVGIGQGLQNFASSLEGAMKTRAILKLKSQQLALETKLAQNAIEKEKKARKQKVVDGIIKIEKDQKDFVKAGGDPRTAAQNANRQLKLILQGNEDLETVAEAFQFVDEQFRLPNQRQGLGLEFTPGGGFRLTAGAQQNVGGQAAVNALQGDPAVSGDLRPSSDLTQSALSGFQLAPEQTVAGVKLERPPTEAELQTKARELQIAGEAESEKQALSQARKAQEESSRLQTRATLVLTSSLDSFIDSAERQMQISGAKPGFLSGSIDAVLSPTKANEFRAGFLGGLIETAATSARVSMPGTRAIRAIEIFKKTTVSPFDSIESGVQTTADSLRAALTRDMSDSPEKYIKNYTGTIEQNELLRKSAQEFEETFRKMALGKVFDRNPALLRGPTADKIRRQRNFPSKAAIDASPLPIGSRVFLNGEEGWKT